MERLLFQIFFIKYLKIKKKRQGYIGTLGLKKNDNLEKRDLTTSDSLSLHKDLEEMKNSNIDNVIIEASSHGLKQKRLSFLKIKAGIFTNLSHDHLDYHKNMKSYLASKLILFKDILKKRDTIITDSDIKQYSLLKKIKNKKKLKIDLIGSKSNIFKILNHKIYESYQNIEIKYKNKIHKLKINLYGSIQIKNLLMAVLAAKTCGLKINDIFLNIKKIKSVNGRLQLVKKYKNNTKVFIDYAHTPAALENAIMSLQEHFKKKITLIFGCGGDRDKHKRILMGKIAKQYCDKVYVTDDNPRNENPKKIRKEILKGLKGSNSKEIPNRAKAIKFVLQNSEPHEIILIAGKGHEDYQDFGKRKIFFSDREAIKKFKLPKKLNNRKYNVMKHNSKIMKKIFQNKNKEYLFEGISINSKKVKKSNLFIAIKGKNNDGHNFLSEVSKKGIKYLVVSKSFKNKLNFLKVKNTKVFLNKFAKIQRSLSQSKFIGITGSSGKTTVKTMIGNLLNIYNKTFFSPSSYNNHFGVPLSLCNMNIFHKFGVFEIGMNKPKEIFNLADIVKPHIGIITNISEAHLENFKNINGIAKAKSEIIYKIQKGGSVILNRDDKFFNYHSKIARNNKIRVISFGYSPKSNIRVKSITNIKKSYQLILICENRKIKLTLGNNNRNHIMNIMCSIAVIHELGLDFNKINNFFKNYSNLGGRGKIHKVRKFKKNFFLVDESYNANPLSVKSAIENFKNIRKKGKRKYFLFGDMLELGKKSIFYHKQVSNLINKSDIDKTFVFGKNSIKTFDSLKQNKKGLIIKNLQNFYTSIPKILKNGDYLMIKGSNATKLHEVSKKILGDKNAL